MNNFVHEVCRICGAYVGDSKVHYDSHNVDPLRGAVQLMGELDSMEVKIEHGIEYADESADDEVYDSFEEAYEALRDHQVERAKDKRRTGEDNYEGMRIVTRRVLTVKSKWNAFAQEGQ